MVAFARPRHPGLILRDGFVWSAAIEYRIGPPPRGPASPGEKKTPSMITALTLAISFMALLASAVPTRRYAFARLVLVIFALGAGNIHLAVVSLAVMLFVNNGYRPPVVHLRRTELIVGLSVGAIILVTFLSPVSPRTLAKLLHLGLFVFILLQLLNELVSAERIRAYLKAMVWAATAVAILGLVLDQLGLVEHPHIFPGRGANEGSVYLSLMGLLPALTLMLWERKPLYLAPCGIMAFAQVVALSRSNTVLAGVMLAAAIFFYFDSRAIKAAMLGVAGLIIYKSLDLINLEVERQVNYSARERIELTLYGWELWLQRPYTGWGWGSTSELVPKAILVEQEYPHFHNTWVQLLAEVGYLGWLFIAMFLFFGLRCIWIALRWTHSAAVSFYVIMAVAGIGWLGFFEALLFGADRFIMLVIVLPIMGYMTSISLAAKRASWMPQPPLDAAAERRQPDGPVADRPLAP